MKVKIKLEEDASSRTIEVDGYWNTPAAFLYKPKDENKSVFIPWHRVHILEVDDGIAFPSSSKKRFS